MRIGVVLPAMADRAEPALEAAEAAEAAGLDGVFVFDHLWQPGTGGNPSLAAFPLLGAIAERTSRVKLGTLVARVGLTPDEVLVASFCSLEVLSGGRVIAGLGTGDAKSAAEHRALGLPYEPAAGRRRSLQRCGEALQRAGIETWIGGGSPETNAIAAELGSPVNLWSAAPERVAAVALTAPVTWGGVLGRDGDAPALLSELAAAGASWAIATWGAGLAPLLEAVRAARLDERITEGPRDRASTI
jgi:alkanesulfonate monooxygenase SsuD/methylene tetrahydromethanopterin reductase-like flavin-dependent oxidoreductase (luciferase family)